MAESGNQPLWRKSPEEFLRGFRFAMANCPYDLKWGGKDWRTDLGDLGLNETMVREIIKGDLIATQAHRGPEPDDERPDGSIVIFRYPIPGNCDAYVKLGLRPHGTAKNRLIPKIWSFKRWS